MRVSSKSSGPHPHLEFLLAGTDIDDRKNSAQKTMHKMFGQDPRSLRPSNREEQNTKFKPVYRRSRRGRKSSGPDLESEDGELGIKNEAYTPDLSGVAGFDDMDTLKSPQQDSTYGLSSDLASPSTLASMSPIGPMFSAFPHDGFDSPFQLPFPRPPRNDTVFSSSTDMSTDSVKGIRERLRVSTIFAKQVTVLMNRLTFNSDKSPMPSPHRTLSDIPTHFRGHPGPVPHPGLAVPGDFIVAPRYVPLCQGEKHFAKYLREGKCACWCVIADETSDSSENFYVTANGEWCDRAANILKGTVEASCVDHFGNTPLHLFATLESHDGIGTVLELVKSGQANPLAVNKAGQTFLHVLSALWFMRLGEPQAPLYQLLNLVWEISSQAVFLRDAYGRTFFHHLDRFVDDIQVFTHISEHYKWGAIPRDAFGVKPPSRATDQSLPVPRRIGTTSLSPLAEEVTTAEDFATREQKLITVVNKAYTNHAFEDEEGRNGLHCLAELSLDAQSPSSPNSPNPDQPANGGGNKRKRGKSDTDGPKPIERRVQFLSGLLLRHAQVTPPDVNHYNTHGRTVLMAFATHLTDEHDKSGQYIGKIIDLLLDRGADIDARNRLGETALHVAARCGNKHVVGRLLERGANLYARDKKGRGIMALLEAQMAQCSRDLQRYGRLEVVRGLVAKRLEETGGEDDPSFLDEWSRTTPTQVCQTGTPMGFVLS